MRITAQVLTIFATFLFSVHSFSQDSNRKDNQSKTEMAKVRKLMDYETEIVLKQDTNAMKQFYPDDMVVTNPYNQVINKRTILDRVKSNFVKYSSYEKVVDYYHLENDDLLVVIGNETIVPASDANRDDRGKTVRRRFTEIWAKRNGEWKQVIRHFNNIDIK
jgi:ketosteroid isomerase-like protein